MLTPSVFRALKIEYKRGGLAAARGSGDQQNAVGPGDHELQCFELFRRQAQCVQRDEALYFVENAQHHVFAVGGRLRGDAEVDIAALQVQADASVLGRPRLGNIHAGHVL